MTMRKPIGVQSMRPPAAASVTPPDEPRPVGAALVVEPTESGAGSVDAAPKPVASSMAVNGGSSLEEPANAATTGANAATEREERGGKKSVAYRHTAFHRMAEDAFGKEFERRMCRYCDAVFSFKGGTTSAALRHIKTAHPERMLFTGLDLPVMAAAPPRAILNPTSAQAAALRDEQQQLEQLQRQQLQQQQQVTVTAIDQQTQEQQQGQQQQMSDVETASSGDVSSIGDVTAETAPVVVADALDSGSGDSAATTAASSASTDEDANYYAQKERKLRSILKRKRESGSFDVDAASRAGVPPASGPSAAAAGTGVTAAAASQLAFLPPQFNAAAFRGTYPRLTASQIAITHFLHHHKDELSVSARLQFAKHLTRNVGEAEMYNVLDDATRAAYIREFADSASGRDDGGNSSAL